MKVSLAQWIIVTCLVSVPAFAVVTPSPPELQAKGYVLMDFQSGAIIAEQNGRAGLAPASLTKLMTAYVVGQEIKAGRLNWDDLVTVSENAWSEKFPGSSKMFIKPKDEISVANLMRGVIIQSGNDACVALAEHVAGSEHGFVALMNGWAEKLGLQDTYFVNSHGLDSEGIQTSPLDMATLMKSIINDVPDVYALYNEKVFKWNDITQYNRNKLLWDKSIKVDGGKTGYTSNAGYSLVSSATEGKMRLISVVMGTPSAQARISQSKNLLSYGFRFYDTKKVATQGQVESKVKVWKGKVSEIEASFPQDAYLTLPRSMTAGLDKSVEMKEPLMAPIEQGEVVGKVVWKNDDETVASYPLVSNQAVEPASWIGQIWDSIVLWVKSFF
ncbi:D-alanyl-D-alanine carboxypeptidase family protein [Vibrio natriegens]|uniref:serine-type D-Ala-D-Ala carboxypeptidase n=1 Tax=Vibrio natriegens NBRC 15636 = ATCC 14048 = DSM 759 TaxID=1219067 RepID=A0AAN0Y6I8_VIBNA|nr:D-alanyl-D-alanine carboxypeptidase family protein [Vibrio natriegens]ALR17405.1 D-alanyl-D-alanine carboxypeptidase [Vibrio natriegens NBRC 15636 = ATCC 14048 = DSM 759]ANQ14896.1 D-alanyl-D-alanine carboxypeptidase [Vibrio natriegens NBRC 15636 = ATCC 14048 = DSM 759]EPM41990.1 D-alanyl-D-alanine carboxypeptidase [Vibrio natriegens NBRC 15636 = ATCC 14048 = DSM 759]MDX6029780.1 D-alanyl-D-alanine carboxypeptidase family protein [Vibrio natriegens NBRC 15636 = ATCC 14048 = DSM 759]UUI13535